MLIGIIAAFGAAISWTYACFVWRSQTEKYKSIDINLLKNIIAFLIFLPDSVKDIDSNKLFGIPKSSSYFFVAIMQSYLLANSASASK